MKYLLVGGAGYVGSRLARRLQANPENTVHVLDPGLLWPEHVPYPFGKRRNAFDEDPRQARDYDCTVWLATIHDVPEAAQQAWEDVTLRLMVLEPSTWQAWAQKFVYFSSMRAVTHPETLYGRRKRRFEDITLASTLVIRPGTVWGGYHPDLPNRNHTALNRVLMDPRTLTEPCAACGGTGEFQPVFEDGPVPCSACADRPTVEIPSNFIHIDNLVDLTVLEVERSSTGIVNATDPSPWKRPELGVHPMEKYRSFYGIQTD